MIKITKLPDGKYKVEETLPAEKQVSIVDKVRLEETIQAEEKEIVNKQANLDAKKELLIKINEAK